MSRPSLSRQGRLVNCGALRSVVAWHSTTDNLARPTRRPDTQCAVRSYTPKSVEKSGARLEMFLKFHIIGLGQPVWRSYPFSYTVHIEYVLKILNVLAWGKAMFITYAERRRTFVNCNVATWHHQGIHYIFDDCSPSQTLVDADCH